jgi:hypothetical protein
MIFDGQAKDIFLMDRRRMEKSSFVMIKPSTQL